mgnify:CR=1 FL=1
MSGEETQTGAQQNTNPFVVDVTNSFRSKATILFVNSGEWKRIEGGILDAIDAEIEDTDLQNAQVWRVV